MTCKHCHGSGFVATPIAQRIEYWYTSESVACPICADTQDENDVLDRAIEGTRLDSARKAGEK